MNTTQAKEIINIIDFLQSNGHKPVKRKNTSFWYVSPFRKEKTPSFLVNNEKNTFIDWGTGQKGTIVDLVMLLHNTDISGALKILSRYRPGNYSNSFSFKKQGNQETKKTIPGTIEKISHPHAISYLEKRGIKREIWENCRQLFQYKYPNPTASKKWFPFFYNIAWKNDSDGYELRNEKFKSCLLKKDVTTIQGNTKEINVFEGFFDYLSALTYYNTMQLPEMTVVLNSVMLLDRITAALYNHETINLYLDNDKAGDIAFSALDRKLENVINKSKLLYPDFKDFNAFMVSKI